MRDDTERLLDILEAIQKIEERTSEDKEAFARDELVQVWVVHHIQIIGEAAGRLSDTLREEHSDIPWPDIISMRNVIVHHYFGLDLDQVWDAVRNDLPTLKTWAEQMLESSCQE